MSISRRNFLKISAASLATACVGAAVPESLLAATRKASKKYPHAKRVVMLGLDGICVEGFKKAHTPNLDRLFAEGAISTTTRVVMPSNTQPNWMSHLSGSGPEQHGVDRNDWLLEKHSLDPIVADADGYYPSVFKILKDNVPGVKTAFYYNWAELINPYNRKWLDEVSFEEDGKYLSNYSKALDFITKHADEPTVVFFYSMHTDHAGHKHKWMSPEYIASIGEADVHIGEVLDELKKRGLYDDTHFMFITDHGGINYGHGGMSPNEMIVPWGIVDPGIRKGFEITEANNTVNTAPVILTLFGVETPLFWTGEILESIFK